MNKKQLQLRLNNNKEKTWKESSLCLPEERNQMMEAYDEIADQKEQVLAEVSGIIPQDKMEELASRLHSMRKYAKTHKRVFALIVFSEILAQIEDSFMVDD